MGKIKGVGNVICGRIEQGTLKPGQEVKFMPTHTAANSCLGKVFTIEMHHKNVPQAIPGDNIGINMKNLNKDNMPKKGDIMVFKNDETVIPANTFDVCPNLARIAMLEGHNCCAIGKITK